MSSNNCWLGGDSCIKGIIGSTLRISRVWLHCWFTSALSNEHFERLHDANYKCYK